VHVSDGNINNIHSSNLWRDKLVEGGVLSIYSKTSLTRTSGDHPKTSVLTEVHVIRKLKKSKQKIALLPCIQLIDCFDRP